MEGSANNLSINSKYLLYTNYSTIAGLKIKVIGILNYTKAQEVPYSIKNLAINEKVVDTSTDNTEEYLKNQLYYLCVHTDSAGKETPYLVWDDVIDTQRTTKLSISYDYSLNLEVSSDLIADLPTIENSINTFIKSTYGNSVIPTLIGNGEAKSTTDTKTQELNRYKELFGIATGVAEKLANLKQIETLINYFAKDDMYEKISGLSEQLSNIESTVATISAQIS
jgi:hypothetical protein